MFKFSVPDSNKPDPAMPSNNSGGSKNKISLFLRRFKGRKRKFLMLFGALAIAAVLAFITTNKNVYLENPFVPSKEDIKIVDEETGELTEEFFENITDITIDQIKEASSSGGVNVLQSPALSSTEQSEQIYEDLGKSPDEVENIELSVSDWGISLSHIEVQQGDLVTWINDSTQIMNIVGEGWKNEIPIEPGERFSYGFLFLGDYKYRANDKFDGMVTVVK